VKCSAPDGRFLWLRQTVSNIKSESEVLRDVLGSGGRLQPPHCMLVCGQLWAQQPLSSSRLRGPQRHYRGKSFAAAEVRTPGRTTGNLVTTVTELSQSLLSITITISVMSDTHLVLHGPGFAFQSIHRPTKQSVTSSTCR
jgi:hypothetical protein